ncbi:hypothetical protein [Paraburkholderia sp. RL17-337-BIB-A]|uniref:hypothetical protein n=1 Tax=Paraburkholderia sp. RL17-337-BIB-A TaxID=3031636 RepID=UPI0038B7DD07
MFHLKSTLVHAKTACVLVLMAMLTQVGTQANAVTVNRAANVETGASTNISAARPFVGDDPVAIRDTLADRHINAAPPSLRDRVQGLIHIPTHKQRPNPDLTAANLDRDLFFLVRVPYGIRYRTETHQLTVNADLSGDENQRGILLKKTTTGPSGRGLVVAPEAKSKGFVQHIDMIELESGESKKTTVRGRVMLSRAAYAEANGDFAIVLVGRLVPPYLIDRSDHRDPTDDEPTDITTRTSRLYVDIRAIWLVSPQRGIVLSKTLHLSK